MVKKAGELYAKAELPLGDGTQTPDQFARMQSATTGLPEHMCRFNMEKNDFVLGEHGQDPRLADARPRSRTSSRSGYGVEARGVPVSYQAQSPVLGHGAAVEFARRAHAVAADHSDAGRPGAQARARRSRGRRTAWRRRSSRPACRSRRSPIYPGLGDVGAAVLQHCPRSLIFGGTATVEQYKGNPRVQAHGPGFSKILLGDDKVDHWEKYLDIMVDSVFVNSGRGCINCSGIWASRHTEEDRRGHRRARSARSQPLPPEDPKSALAAFTVPGQADGVNADIDSDLKEAGVTRHDRQVRPAAGQEGTLRLPAADGHPLRLARTPAIAKKEYMFPFVHGGEVPAGEDAREDRPDAGLLGDHRGHEVPAGADRRHAHRPPEHRPDADDQAELAAAARGEHRRLPVPRRAFQHEGPVNA